MKNKLFIISLICLSIVLVAVRGFSQDSFNPEAAVVLPVPHIGTLTVVLIMSVNPDNPATEVKFSVAIDNQFNNTMRFKDGNLIPYLTTAQKNQLIAFMDLLWTKAEDEILP